MLAVVLGLDLGKDLDERAHLVDDKRGTDHAHVGPPEQLLLAPSSVQLGHVVVRIAEEREGQLVLGLELVVGLRGVRADAQNDRASRKDF